MTTSISRRSFIAAASAVALGTAGAWRVGALLGTDSIDDAAIPDPVALPTRLTTTTTSVPPPPKGRIMFPMQPGSKCTVLNNFGDCRPIGSCSRRHQGVDILGELGLECYAVDDGVITKKETHPTAGLMMDFEATRDGELTGTYYSYQHLSAFADTLEIGVPVKRGQVLGYVGDTGNPGPGNYHLHFEWHPATAGGAARDPFDRLLIPTSCTTFSQQDPV